MSDAAGQFEPTRWTLVQRAQGTTPAAQQALSELCAGYYEPVVGFLRRMEADEATARERAHDFFATLLTRDSLRADPTRGRFRSYLLGAVKHFVFDQRDRERAAKRGGDVHFTELREAHAPAIEEQSFDRQWALTVLGHALHQLASEWGQAGRAEHFAMLKPWLTGAGDGRSQAELAATLGLNENAVKVAIHRLRQKFREAVRREIAQTVTSPAEVDEEVRYLLQALTA
jgi:RNA polymerase sigma factor (sigma-70 family)